MAIDTGQFLRLKNMVDAVLASSNEKSRGLQAKALSDAYTAFRDEARPLATSEGMADEFNRLFPDITGKMPATSISGAGYDPFAAASYANQAAAALARLSGWLSGFIEQARMTLEADAYAKARLAQEGPRT